MKRKILNIGLAVVLMFGASSCDDFLDINEDPNNPTSAPAELVFPAAVVSTASVVGGDYAILGGIWSQYWTQSNAANQYKSIDAYDLRPLDFQNRWAELYAGSLNDLKYVKQEADANGDGNLHLMATVMEAYTYQVLTDIYDQIPFNEALQGSVNISPAFESGQTVYDGLISRINESMAKASGGNSPIANKDIVFGGNINNWIRFANTLKLKIYLRQSEARPDVAADGVRALYANADFLETDAAVNIFSDVTSKRNPLFEQDQSPALNTDQNLRASRTLLTFLEGNNDPRLEIIFMPPSGAPQKGLEQGGFNIPSTVVPPTTVSRARISPIAPVYFISKAESYFLQAEAVVRGWGTGDAKALYDAGVRASFAQLANEAPNYTKSPKPTSVPTEAQADSLLNGAYAFPVGGTMEEQIKAIITQKWVALAGTTQGIEAFFERNRTGIPKTSPEANSTAANYVPGEFIFSLGAVTPPGQFARRLLTPENELTRNPNSQSALKPITTKVWWAKDNL